MPSQNDKSKKKSTTSNYTSKYKNQKYSTTSNETSDLRFVAKISTM